MITTFSSSPSRTRTTPIVLVYQLVYLKAVNLCKANWEEKTTLLTKD